VHHRFLSENRPSPSLPDRSKFQWSEFLPARIHIGFFDIVRVKKWRPHVEDRQKSSLYRDVTEWLLE
jgi:hypothetical protein